MATFVLENAHLTLNAVDLSDHVRSLTLNAEVEAQDDTVMSDLTRVNLAGLKNWSFEVEFAQDFAAAEVDATVWAAYDAKTAFTWVIRADAGVISATNPSYSATGFITSYAPIGGGVGDVAVAPISVVPAGASPTLVRAVA